MSVSAKSATPRVALHDVCKRFGTRAVLRELSLSVWPGELFALAGTNGAGKTTCIKGLLDFCSIDSGRIAIDGVAHDRPHARSGVYFLPERFSAPYYLTGRDFLRYSQALHRSEYEDAAARAMAVAVDLDEEALLRPAREYSKGMSQKLGLAAAFLSGKQLLILDEPMSGLDPRARLAVKAHLETLREGGTTVMLTTHMLSDVESLCDRVGILHGGQMAFVGAPSSCLEETGRRTLEEAFLAVTNRP